MNWKNSNTTSLQIHRFILKEHYSDLNEEMPCNYKLNEYGKTSDNIKKKKKFNKNYIK